MFVPMMAGCFKYAGALNQLQLPFVWAMEIAHREEEVCDGGGYGGW